MPLKVHHSGFSMCSQCLWMVWTSVWNDFVLVCLFVCEHVQNFSLQVVPSMNQWSHFPAFTTCQLSDTCSLFHSIAHQAMYVKDLTFKLMECFGWLTRPCYHSCIDHQAFLKALKVFWIQLSQMCQCATFKLLAHSLCGHWIMLLHLARVCVYVMCQLSAQVQA